MNDNSQILITTCDPTHDRLVRYDSDHLQGNVFDKIETTLRGA